MERNGAKKYKPVYPVPPQGSQIKSAPYNRGKSRPNQFQAVKHRVSASVTALPKTVVSDTDIFPFGTKLTEDHIPVVNTCPKCEHLIKSGNFLSIHSTLAYSRCRCHRNFRFYLKHFQSQPQPQPQPQIVATGIRIKSRVCTSSVKPANDEGVTLESHGKRLSTTHKHGDELQRLPPLPVDYDSRTSLHTPPEQTSHLRSQHSLVSFQSLPHSGHPSVTQLPKLGCPSLVVRKLELSGTGSKTSKFSEEIRHHASQTSSSPKRGCIYELVDILRYIPVPKRGHLKEVFKTLDKDGDGHLSLTEFLSGLPFTGMTHTIENTLTQFYYTMSATTFFGCREFIVCYCIAEVFVDSPITVKVNVTRDFVEHILHPYARWLSKYAVDGIVSVKDIKDAVSELNMDKHIPRSISIATSKLTQVAQNNSLSLLKCVALAPYYLCEDKKA